MKLLNKNQLILALATDLQEVRRLRGLVFAPATGEQLVTLTADLHPTTLHFLAYKNGAAVGCLTLSQCDLEIWEGVRIQLLAVDPDFQGQQIGATLLAQAIVDASVRWPEKILWLSSTEQSKPFYIKHGFLPFIETPCSLANSETILIKS